MTSTNIASSPTEPPKKCGRKKCIAVLLVLLVVVAAAAYFSSSWFIGMHGGALQNSLELQQKLITAESRLEALEAQMSEMRERLREFETSPKTDETKDAPKSATDLGRLQSDMIALSSAMSALQMEVKQTGSHAALAQQVTQTSVAAAIAFVQLREAANSGRSFLDEFDTLRKATKSDAAFQEQLVVLEPYADKGVPTVTALHEELLTLENSALQAIERASAQNWWQRVLAELKGLISIRPLHGAGAPDTLTALENNIAKGDMTAALEEAKNLNPEAQKTLASWRTKVEAREKIDQALHIMAQRFVARAEPKPVKKDEP